MMETPPEPIPQLRGNLLRNVRSFHRDPIGQMGQAFAELGDTVQFSPIQRALIATRDPDVVYRVLVGNVRNYVKQTRGYNIMRHALGQGLVTSEGELWRRQRRLAQPAFHRKRIAQFGETMVAATHEMMARWQARSEPEVSLELEMNALTLAIVCRTLLGSDAPADIRGVGADLALLNEFLGAYTRNILAAPLWIPTGTNRRYKAALGRLDDITQRIIAQRRAQGPEGDGDLLDMLMAATDEETGVGMSDAQLRDEVLTMFVAGHETTSMNLIWTLYLLDRNPASRQALEAELEAVLGGRDPTVDDLSQLPFLEQVVKESLRVLPPVPFIARMAVEEDRLGPYAVAAGSMVLISLWSVHRNPSYWPDPDSFIPERFDPDNKANVHDRAFIPFSMGQRKCIGDSFAYLEAKLILATLLQRYRLRLKPGTEVAFNAAVTLRPAGPLPMIFEAR